MQTNVKTIRNDAMAVSAGVSSYFKLAQIIIGKVSFPPMMNSATIRSSKEMKNEKTADEMIAGRIAGKVTSQKACVGPAPKNPGGAFQSFTILPDRRHHDDNDKRKRHGRMGENQNPPLAIKPQTTDEQ